MKLMPLLILLTSATPVSGQPPVPSVGAWTVHRAIVSTAAAVEMSRLGVHTHADFLLFRTGETDVAALKSAPNVRSVRIVAHCRYPTDKAALPPGFAWLSKNYGKVPSYGAIDGNPGWSVSRIYQDKGQNLIRISVPTRFANWVAAQTPTVRRRYLGRGSYSLSVSWQRITGSSR